MIEDIYKLLQIFHDTLDIPYLKDMNEWALKSLCAAQLNLPEPATAPAEPAAAEQPRSIRRDF